MDILFIGLVGRLESETYDLSLIVTENRAHQKRGGRWPGYIRSV